LAPGKLPSFVETFPDMIVWQKACIPVRTIRKEKMYIIFMV
jgi:hypothetical protein